uniref:Uncharacterized protein n=1 Tax=Spumella elongata TaxID=89044 RepID=A0A7S3MK82_9STRA
MQSAVRKLTEAAWRYDKMMPGAPCLDAFESEHMEPHVLKEQLKKGFYMKVTPPELGAIVHLFDTDNIGKISCEQFLKKFFKTGFDERQRQKVEWREHEKSIAERTIQKKTAKLKAQEDKIAFVDVDHNYTEADFQSAFQKLTTGAMKYDRAGPGAVGLNAFEAVSMPPHIFKEQLKLVFNVNVTLPELWALVAYFDRDQSGVVNCKHFLTQFLRTGLEERIRIRQTWRKEEEERRLKDKQKEEMAEAEKVKKAWAEVDFEFLEPDFDSMINIFVDMCFNFDRRQLGPAGLSAFQVDSLNPAEFREMLKRTFNLKLTARELGAMVTYFDSKGKKVADCAMFLNAVVQVRVQCEEFKGRPDEEKLKKEYIAQLKEHYRLKMARNPSMDARPWRTNAVLAKENHFVKSVVKPVGVAPPATPLEKYKLRISVGKQTGRMDLACKSVWPADDGSRALSHSNSVSSSLNSSLVLPPRAPQPQQDASQPETQPETPVEIDGGNSESVAQPAESGAFLTQEREVVEYRGNKSSFLLEEVEDGDADGDGEGIFDQVSTAREGDEEAAFVAAALTSQLTRTDTSAAGASLSKGASGSVSKLGSKGRSATKKRRPKEMMLDFRLSVIPREVLKLTELSELWLTNNNITVIPPALGELQQLLVLNLSYNKIDTLPAEVCQLVNLRKLYVRGNLLASLPNVMGQMNSLLHLDCAYNKFTTFPEVVTTMPRLVHLDFAFNRIPSLPATLELLQCLVYLNLCDNVVTKPQNVLLRMPWLEVLGCPISAESRGAIPYAISPHEEHELTNLIKSRAAASLMAKLRRKKKKPSYL